MRVYYEQDGGVGGEGPKYESQMSPELRGNPIWKEMPTISDMGREVIKLRELSAKSITIPDEKSTPEQHRAFYDRMGVPKAPTEYELSAEGLPDNAKALESMFRDNALKAGLTKNQAKKQWDMLSGIIKNGSEQQKVQLEQSKQTFDARLHALLEPKYPVEADRKTAAEETVNLFKAHVTRTGLGKQYEKAGLVYDPSFVLAIAADEKSRSPQSMTLGSGTTQPKTLGAMGDNYSDDFLKFAGKAK
jgi:hypothetical protein